MPTLYTSTRLPSTYTSQDPWSIKNGVMAKAGIVNAIADNQVFLSCGVMPYTNFFQVQQGSTVGWKQGAWANALRTVTVLVPPFCQYAEFYFFAAKDFNDGSATLSYIEIAGNTDRRITHIPAGEDLTTTAKSDIGDQFSGAWVRASGMSQHPLSDDPGAVQLVASTTNTWRRVNVDITVSALCYVRAAAYRVLPPKGTFTITY